MDFNFTTIKDFYKENVSDELLKKTGLSVGIFGIVIVSQVILHGLVEVIDSIPVFNSLMQVVGVYATARFVLANLITQEQRNSLREKVEDAYKDVVG